MREIVNIAVIRNNKLLLVRDNDRAVWTLPGGGKEAGEDDISCIRREISEELTGVDIERFRKEPLCHLGTFRGISPTKKDIIFVTVYLVSLEGEIRPGKDVQAICWASIHDELPASDITKEIIVSIHNLGHLA